MGSNVSKLSYMSQATNDLEKEIRIFECSELLNNDNSLKERSFNSIYTHICFDSEFFQGENPKNLEIFLNENFNKLIAEFILNTPFFRSQDGLYDMRRIRLLLFTLTFNTNVKTNTKENPDKVILKEKKFILLNIYLINTILLGCIHFLINKR